MGDSKFGNPEFLYRSDHGPMLKLSEIKELIKLIDQTSIDELELEKEGSRLSIRKTKPQIIEGKAAPAPVYAQPVIGAAISAPEVQAGSQAAAASAGPAPKAEAAGSVGQREEKGLHRIVSPMVGTFYRAPSPDAPPFVNKGDKVHEKTVVCIVEAMKLMNEIEAEVKGEIVDVLVENGQLVEYGQPLFLVKTE